MKDLSSSTAPDASTLLYRMYRDNSSRFSFERRTEHHQAMIKGFCEAGLVGEAVALAKRLKRGMGIWQVILRAAVYSDPDRVEEVSTIVRQTRNLDVAEFELLIENVRRQLSGSPLDDRHSAQTTLKKLLREMRELGFEMTRRIEEEVLRLELGFGKIERAEGIAAGWTEAEEKTRGMWVGLMKLAIYKHDQKRVIELCQMMAKAGVSLYEEGLLYLVQGGEPRVVANKVADLIDAVKEAEQVTGCQATASFWTGLIQNILESSLDSTQLDEALQIYRFARGAGVQVDINLARSLIRPFCIQKTSIRLDQALEVYNDLVISDIPLPDLGSRQTMTFILNDLIFACSYSSDAFPTALRLLEDMNLRGLSFATRKPRDLQRLVVRFMRLAPDHRAAFIMYSTIHSSVHAILDEPAFRKIAIVFLQLFWEASPFVPLNLFIEMMKDMHRAGFRPGSTIFTTLLHQYGQVASKEMYRLGPEDTDEKESVRKEIQRAIEGLHTRIRLDPLINITVPLLNALMDAYNRVYAWRLAFEVWEELVERRSREPVETVQKSYVPSLCIVLDACGYGQFPRRARKVLAWARRHHLADAIDIWNTYVECLCRCDQMDEAVRLVCEEMKEERNGVMKPSFKCCEILLKFSCRDPVWYVMVQRRVREVFPEWWEDLKGILEKMRDGGQDQE